MAVISVVSQSPLLVRAVTEALAGRHVVATSLDAAELIIAEKNQPASVPVVVVDALPITLVALEEKIQAAMESNANQPVDLGGAQLNKQAKCLQYNGKKLAITEKEVALLAALAPGVPVARETLLAKVWGYGQEIDTHTLETHIHRLRGKLKAAGLEECITSSHDGYAWVKPVG